MTVAASHRYRVVGHWPFPSAMLGRDGSKPATAADRRKIAILTRDVAPGRRKDLDAFEITLVGPRPPCTARWESFKWSVPDDHEHRLLMAERDARASRAALLDSALAKLSPEEREAVVSAMGRSRPQPITARRSRR